MSIGIRFIHLIAANRNEHCERGRARSRLVFQLKPARCQVSSDDRRVGSAVKRATRATRSCRCSFGVFVLQREAIAGLGWLENAAGRDRGQGLTPNPTFAARLAKVL